MNTMDNKPTYEELEQRVKELEDELVGDKLSAKNLEKEREFEQESNAISEIIQNMLQGEVDDAKTELNVLNICLKSTGSIYGMIGKINKEGNYDTTTYSSQTLEDCAFPEALAWELSTGMPIRGIWGFPMLHGKPLICNDLTSHPDRVGQPEGHVTILRFLGVPLKLHEKVTGMVAVANKPDDYTIEDRDTLIRLAAVISVSAQYRQELAKRKQAEEEALLMKHCVDHASDAVFWVDKNASFIYVNKAACRHMRRSREELLAMKVHDVDPLYQKENWSEFWHEFKEKGSLLFESINLTPDGKKIPVEISVNYLEHEGQGFMHAYVRDIIDRKRAEEALKKDHDELDIRVKQRTAELVKANKDLQSEIFERKQAEEELRRSHESFKIVMDSLDALVYVADMNTYEILFINKYGRDIWGELVGKICWQSLQTGQTGPCEFCTNAELLDESGRPKAPYIWEFQNTVNKRWYECRDQAVQWPSGHYVRMEIATEITDRKKLEEELLKVQKLESTGILAGGIAHDFNNLLMGILGNISLAKLYAKTNEQVLEKLNAAEKASARAQDLTKQLLTFSKGGEPVVKPAVITDLLRDSISFTLSGSNVKSDLSIADNLWPVMIDEGQISQVIQNVVKNADQAMPDGGIVTIRAENKTISREDALPLNDGRYVMISIEDTGIGIMKEHIPKVFDPYFSTKNAGSGLGLASAYSIIKNHGGLITVDSRLGKGTTFHIYLPVSEESPDLPKGSKEEFLSGGGRVLIMDDEKSVIQVAVEMLKFMGFAAEAAKDGSEAITLYKKAHKENRPFDAVILDLTIPGGMGGKETIKKLLEIDPHIKAIVSSGYANDPIMADFASFGFKDVIAKPYKIQELNDVLLKVLA